MRQAVRATFFHAFEACPPFFVARRLERLVTNHPPWGRFDLIAVLLSKFGTPIQPWLSAGFSGGLTLGLTSRSAPATAHLDL